MERDESKIQLMKKRIERLEAILLSAKEHLVAELSQ